MRIAVIGTGISGNLVARILASRHQVTLFEANPYPGGHSNTVDVDLDGTSYPVDTGFMVFNRRTYPNFCRMLELLEVPSRESDMSFSVRCDSSGLEYQGSSLNGLFAQRRNLGSPSFYQMLSDILRFNRLATQAATEEALPSEMTVGDFLAQCRLGQKFRENYLQPMTAAIWSASPSDILSFPAAFLVGFCHNHGLLQIRNRPQWRTIVGGSRVYVQRLLAALGDQVRLNCPVRTVRRDPDGVSISFGETEERFDEVVFATHSDQALRLLDDPTPTERSVLGDLPYQKNEAVLHLDQSLLPKSPRAHASWNYRRCGGLEDPVTVTYDLSRLQGHNSSVPILLSLNCADGAIDSGSIIQTMTYAHPGYSLQSLCAQQRWSEISGHHRTHYCGAYWGYGFHEDGVKSALAVAERFGLTLEACTVHSIEDESPTAATVL